MRLQSYGSNQLNSLRNRHACLVVCCGYTKQLMGPMSAELQFIVTIRIIVTTDISKSSIDRVVIIHLYMCRPQRAIMDIYQTRVGREWLFTIYRMIIHNIQQRVGCTLAMHEPYVSCEYAHTLMFVPRVCVCVCLICCYSAKNSPRRRFQRNIQACRHEYCGSLQ